MNHNLPSASAPKPCTKVFEAEAAKFAEDMAAAGFETEMTPTAAEVGAFAAFCCVHLKLPFEASLRLAERLDPFFRGTVISKRSLFRVGLWVHAVKSSLLKGEVPPAPSQAKIAEDFPGVIQCIGLDPLRIIKTGKLWSVSFLLLNTSLAGMEFETHMPGGFISGMLRVVSCANRDRDSCDPAYLFGMRILAVLGTSGRGGLTIKQIRKKDSLHARNSGLRKMRTECPHGPCITCPRGTNTCSYAIKRYTKES